MPRNVSHVDRSPPYVVPMDPAERSDAHVVRDVLAGDRDAYRVLVRRYQDVLFAHALRQVGDYDTAAELVQQAFVRGFEKLGKCREPERVGGWLFRILSNLTLDRVRSPRRKDLPLEALTPLGDSSTADPQTQAARAEFREDFQRALQSLTPEQREAFVLKHVDGVPYDEMSRLMAIPVAALKMRVHRARTVLKDILEVYA